MTKIITFFDDAGVDYIGKLETETPINSIYAVFQAREYSYETHGSLQASTLKFEKLVGREDDSKPFYVKLDKYEEASEDLADQYQDHLND